MHGEARAAPVLRGPTLQMLVLCNPKSARRPHQSAVREVAPHSAAPAVPCCGAPPRHAPPDEPPSTQPGQERVLPGRRLGEEGPGLGGQARGSRVDRPPGRAGRRGRRGGVRRRDAAGRAHRAAPQAAWLPAGLPRAQAEEGGPGRAQERAFAQKALGLKVGLPAFNAGLSAELSWLGPTSDTPVTWPLTPRCAARASCSLRSDMPRRLP